jgi:general secretion pathway protein L
LRPAVIEAVRPIGPPCRIALAHEATRAQRLRRAGLVAAAGACAALALTAILVPLVRQSIALADTDTQIAALQPRVTEAETLRNRIAARTSGADVIAAESARLGSALQAIAALTDILPDDTYLTTLSMRQRQLTLNGSSAAAAKLIGALSADPLMRNPTFAAPVTRSENGKSDLFSIRAELRS